MMQWQREEWKKDSGWIEKNGDWESEDINDVNQPIHTFHHYNFCQRACINLEYYQIH
jgi:hypothetical protein